MLDILFSSLISRKFIPVLAPFEFHSIVCWDSKIHYCVYLLLFHIHIMLLSLEIQDLQISSEVTSVNRIYT